MINRPDESGLSSDNQPPSIVRLDDCPSTLLEPGITEEADDLPV